MSKRIPLTQGRFAIVDDADFEWLNQSQWHWQRKPTGNGYAVRTPRDETGKHIMLKMHRLILNAPSGIDTDHRNMNGLDNRRCNLRLCTKSQNNMNKPKPQGSYSSRYKGVHWDKEGYKWEAQIKIDGHAIYLGRFSDERLAALAYNAAALEHFGEFARLNLISEEDPDRPACAS